MGVPNSLSKLVEEARWPNEVECPYCHAKNITPGCTDSRKHCNACNRSFSAIVGTCFQGSRLTLARWAKVLRAVSSEPEISCRRLAHATGVSKNTAVTMLQRVGRATVADRTLFLAIIAATQTTANGENNEQGN